MIWIITKGTLIGCTKQILKKRFFKLIYCRKRAILKTNWESNPVTCLASRSFQRTLCEHVIQFSKARITLCEHVIQFSKARMVASCKKKLVRLPVFSSWRDKQEVVGNLNLSAADVRIRLLSARKSRYACVYTYNLSLCYSLRYCRLCHSSVLWNGG